MGDIVGDVMEEEMEGGNGVWVGFGKDVTVGGEGVAVGIDVGVATGVGVGVGGGV